MGDDLNLTGDQTLQPAAGGGGDQKTVPLAALEDERGKRQALEEKVRSMDEQIALYRANVNLSSQNIQQQQVQVKEKDLFEGMDEGDVMTVGEVKKVLKSEKESLTRDLGGFISEMQMMMQNPDYKEVLSKHLPNVLKSNPSLAMAIKTSQNPYLLAYELGKTDPEYVKAKTGDQLNKDAGKIIDNLNKPQLGNLGGGGGGLSQVDLISNLSDDQLEEKIAQVKNK